MIPNDPSIYEVGSSIAPSPLGERDKILGWSKIV